MDASASLASKAFIGIGQIRPLGSDIPEPGGGCGTSGGEGKASCGSSGGPEDMPAEIWEKVKNHPCYSEE
ncbi:MAG: nitrogenase cofactor biosynthesis protein NifB, partial [Aquabacterium sp.]